MGFWIEQDEPERRVQPPWVALTLRPDGRFALVHQDTGGDRVETPLGHVDHEERPER